MADTEKDGSAVAAIVLAAGMSRRYGRENKLLADAAGEPLVRRVVARVLASRARPVLVVTGHDSEGVRAALAGLAVDFVHNPDFERGMGTSVAAAVRLLQARDGVTGAAVLLGDMPEIDAALLDRMLEAFAGDGGRRIVFPVDREGRQRNPVLWPRSLFEALAGLDGDRGGRDLIQQHAGATLPLQVADENAISRDIDTPEALAAWRAGRRG